MNHTQNYALPSWESSDRILMEDFNDAFETIDTQMKAHSDAIAGKAAQSTVNSLTQTVSGKANQSDLTALTQTVSSKASQSDLNSLTQTVAQKGNCQIEIQTYVGSGLSDHTYPNSATFSAPPAVFYVAGGSTVGYWARGADILWVRPGNSAYSCSGSWSADGRTYSWWNSSVEFQMNKSGVTYTVVALIPLGE